MYHATVVNFKLKVQIANGLLGKNFFSKILLIWPYAQAQDGKMWISRKSTISN